MIFRAGWSYHHLDRRTPGFHSATKQSQCIAWPCSGGGRYIPGYTTVPPFPAPPQWVGTPTSFPTDICEPWPTSAAPSGGQKPQYFSPTRVSGPMSWTQKGVPIAPPPHRPSSSFSYPLSTFPIYSPSVPIFPATSGGSFPPPVNNRLWTTTSVPSTVMRRPPSAVSHTSRRPASSDPLSTQPTTSVTSSPFRSGTSLNLGEPDWGPPVEQ